MMEQLDLFEQDKNALDSLFQEVGVYKNKTDYLKLFKYIKKFPKVAPFNAMLLHIQKPGAVYVASADEWTNNFNRTIKPEARPLLILWPFAPVHFVYELSDTEGDDFPEELLHPFKTSGQIDNKSFYTLTSNLPRYGISYHESKQGAQSAGSIQISKNQKKVNVGKHMVNIKYNLIVNSNHTQEEKFATIAHELGHLFCGHLGSPNGKIWPDRRKINKNEAEFEAESVAWLVCERMNIKNPSAQYLSDYMSTENEEVPTISLESVITAAGKIETMMQRAIKIDKYFLA